MKKILFFAIFLAAITLNAQKAPVVVSEDFSGGVVPPSGWTIDAHSSNWKISNTKNAGGEAPELDFNWNPQFNGTSHFISPVYDVSSASSLILKFKQSISDYRGGYTIGVATTSDSGATWNTVWSENVNGDIDAEEVSVILNNADLGANFQFCFYFSGSNSYNINDWYIDDILLVQSANLDLAVESINNYVYQDTGDKNIDVTLNNLGETNITSFDITYQIDTETPVTESVSGVNIALAESYNYVFSNAWIATPGDHNVKVWISNVNGGADDDVTNDTLNKTIHIASQQVQRTVLYEEFTSSTCSPCAQFNSNYFTPTFIQNNEGKCTLIKYQMNWPGSGDPYYTAEGGVRRAYYGVSGVPTLFIDANEGTHFNTSQLQNDLDAEYAIPAFVDMSGQFCVLGNYVHFAGDVTPYFNAQNFTLQVGVVEKTTTGNVGSNGETEFHNVMMKMLPDANGTTVSLNDGATNHVEFAQDMSSTNVEEMSDLAVVFFIQNDDGHKVFQSAYAVEDSNGYTISPADSATNVNIDQVINVDFIMPVRFTDNSEITDDLISNFITVKDSSDNQYSFTATIDSTKQDIVISPVDNWPSFTQLFVTVDGSAIEDNYDNPLPSNTTSFFTNGALNIKENNLNVNVYPIPADDYINIDCPANAEITISSVNGLVLQKTVSVSEKTKLNVSMLSTGVYFIKIKTQEQQQTLRFIKK